MKYSIQFQYKPKDAARPGDWTQNEDLEHEPGEPIMLPAVGDTVVCTLTADGPKMYKVLTRNFSYLTSRDVGACCAINIVVTDVGKDEMLARTKE